MDLNAVIRAGGTGALDPMLYGPELAGYGSSIYDILKEDPQPACWKSGVTCL